MNNSDSIKKVLVGLIILLAIVAAVTVIATMFMNRDQSSLPTDQSGEETQQEITKTDVESTKVPDKFPANVPMEEGAKITQNYNATAKDGRFQATRAFETSRTLAQNLTTYQTYMNSNGWEIKSTIDQENYKMLFATKDNATLQVDMNNNLEMDVKTVNISYTETAAQ